MKTLKLVLTWLIPVGLLTFTACSRTVTSERYIDAANGDDASNGKTPETAWRSLEKINEQVFGPGAAILFKAGAEWTGELSPRGSGSAGHPIRIDRYGSGKKPAIHGTGGLYAIYLFNQEYWEIENLEITNFNASEETMDREQWEANNVSYWIESAAVMPQYTEKRTRKCAILVEAEDFGVVHHLQFRNLEIHGVNGNIRSKDNGGIFLEVRGEEVPTWFDGLLIEECHIHDVDRTGISNKSTWMHRSLTENRNWTPNRSVLIRHNRFERTGANALIVRVCDSALMEHNLFTHCSIKQTGNAFYPFNCDNTIMQYNESCYTQYNEGDADAGGFDSDWRSKNCLIQYNYSHDNEYGGILICNMGSGEGFNDNTIVRYNIFQNNAHHVIRVSGEPTNTTIHNNVIYCGPGMSDQYIVWHKDWRGYANGTFYYNNIFYNLGEDNRYDLEESTNNVFDHNIFFGKPAGGEPVDPNKITADPLFKDPGSGGMGFASLEGYKITEGSPAINSGRPVPGNADKDFWGNEIKADQAPDRGVMEYK